MLERERLGSIARMQQRASEESSSSSVVDAPRESSSDTATHPPPGLVRLVTEHGRIHEKETQSMRGEIKSN